MNKIWWRTLHSWLGILSTPFLLILLVTGILLNHPDHLQKGKIETIALDPTNSQRIFAGHKDGLYLSEDGGKKFEEVPMLHPPQQVVDIAFSPQNFKEIYLLEKWGRILSSKDGGKIWNYLSPPFDAQTEGIELKKLSIGEKGKLLLLTSHGWLFSSDDGTTWDETYLDKDRTPLHRLITTLHNGYFFGPVFVWLYDFSAVALLILIISGFILWNIRRKSG